MTTFDHCYRESNHVADALATLGQQERSFFHKLSALPSGLRSLISMDSVNLPSIRVRRRVAGKNE